MDANNEKGSYLYYLSTFGFCCLAFSIARIFKNTFVESDQLNLEYQRVNDFVNHQKVRLANFNSAQLDLGESNVKDNLGFTDFQKVVDCAVRVVAENLNCSRVSVWFFSSDGKSIEAKKVYQNGGFSPVDITLKEEDYPSYFDALRNKQYIVANDAQKDADTQEFTDTYLKPWSIFSMLDCPIVVDQKVIGVICFEHQDHFKEWQFEDILFVQCVSDFISINIKNIENEQLSSRLRQGHVSG
jgi:transcriptional regulator with GAF, ATPase, and Fis domain